MEIFLVYLLKSCGILAMFYGCFKFFLQQETFFIYHRVYLISGIFTALLFPLWTLTELVIVEALPYALKEAPIAGPTAIPTADPVLDWWQVTGILYFIGVLIFLGRFALQLASLKRLMKRGTATVRNDRFTYIETCEETSPFSFFHIIVYNPKLHSPTELETILAHEKVHARQKHSLDILLIHLFSAFQWINPFVWRYKAAISRNLEYIADQEATKHIGNCKEYQYLLLKNSAVSTPHSSIINPIFNSSIKKRIVMLNKNRSQQIRTWKFSLVIPFLAFFLVAFNTKTVTQVIPLATTSAPGSNDGNTDTTEIAYTIDKTSTDAYLKEISATLKKEHQVDLVFKDIARNTEGHITAISSSFRGFGASGSASASADKAGIEPFIFSFDIDSDGELISIGYNMEVDPGKEKTGQNIIQKSDIHKILEVRSSPFGDPLFIVDGVEQSIDAKSMLDPSEIESITVLKSSQAMEKYGDKGKNGVIEIITKKNRGMSSTDPDTQEQNPRSITIKGFKASDAKQGDSINSAQGTITVKGFKVSDNKSIDSIQPLIIVDGMEKETDYELNSISPDDIKSISIYKDENAIQKFGEKGENGVIDITTKKNGWTVGYGINTDDPNDLFSLDPFRQNGLERAIVIVDGINMGKKYTPTLKHSDIESILTALPSKSTSDKYGKQGKNGVIEITTRKK